MAGGPRQLCAVALPATTLTDMYTASLDAVISTIVVCNRGSTSTAFRLSHAVGGAADAYGQYYAYDLPILPNTMVPFTMGICLTAGDVLRGYAGNANLTVTAWGEEQGVNGDMGASFFLELADTPASYTGEAGKAVLVNPTEDGLIFSTVETAASAPVDAEFIVATTNAVLTGERVLTNTATVTWDFSVAGQAKATAVVPSSYTNEDAQDAVGTILVDSSTIDLTYTDATPSITAAVIAGSITTTHLGDDQVTYPKIQNVTDNRLLGRSAGSAGDVQEITLGTGLSLAAGVLSASGGAAPTGTANTIAYFDAAGALASEAAFGYEVATHRMSLGTGPAVGTGLAINVANCYNALDLAVRTNDVETSVYGLYVGEAVAEGAGSIYDYEMISVDPEATVVSTGIYGVVSRVPSGAGRWNFYAPTMAPNYLAGGVLLGNAPDTTDGTIRYMGTDFQGRKGGVWVSFTVPAALSLTTGMLAADAVTYAKIQNVTDNRLLGRSAGSAGDVQEVTIGTGLSLAAGVLTSTVTKTFRLGHTWALAGDVTTYTTLPSMFIPLVAGQTGVLYGVRVKLGSGTSVGVQVRRNGGNVGSVITVTATAATTTLGNVALADTDDITFILSAPVGTPTNLSMTLIVDYAA